MKRSIVILMIALFSSILFSGTTGKIKGIVTDENGEPLEGANIMVVGKTWGAETDEDGYYYIIGVRAGTYQLKCQYIGYSPKTFPKVKVRVGLTSSKNFKLISEAIEIEEIEIEVFTEEIQMDVTTSIRNVDMGTMETQAVSEVGDVLSSQAGIKKDADGELHFRGGRAGEVNYVIDGISVGDPTGVKSEPVSINFANVESFNIQKGIPDAEYGDALSGSVNIVMKVGDQFKTSGHAKYTTDTFLGKSRLDYTRGEFSLSGPIPIPGMKEKPTYYIASDFTTQNGFGNTYRELGDPEGDYYEYGDFDLTGFGFEMGQNRRNNFNIILKTAYQITPMMNISTSYTKSRTHDYNFNWLYRYTPQTTDETITDVTIFNVNFKHTINQQSYYDFIFSYYNRDYKRLPGGKYPDELVFSDSLDAPDKNHDIINNGIRDGGDAEGYEDTNNNGYFDREYFVDGNGSSNWEEDEDYVDADNNGEWDGDYLYDSDGDKKWDYWKNGRSYNGFASGDFVTVGGDSVTVSGSIYNNPLDVVEGYKDNNMNGHYDVDIYGVAGDEPFTDGDVFQDTGEPFVDMKKIKLSTSGRSLVEEANNTWDEREERTFLLRAIMLTTSGDDSLVTYDIEDVVTDFMVDMETHVSDSYLQDMGVDTVRTLNTYFAFVPNAQDSLVLMDFRDIRFTIIYPEEDYLDLRSSLGSVEQPTTRYNAVYDSPGNTRFDEYEAYCAWRQTGSSTEYDDLGWQTSDHAGAVKYVGSYVVYETTNEIHTYLPNYRDLNWDTFSTWTNLNPDENTVYDYPNEEYDPNEEYVDYNENGVRNENAGFLLPDTYLNGIAYQDFDNTVMKFKGNYTNQINKFHMVKTGFELTLN
ncbi:MAG: TonB-dependent receptor, partial [Candidatus Delongbacteria bacterium]|nr:TonB-dependent receptor [Candidatus Delongbacteria bacterium]